MIKYKVIVETLNPKTKFIVKTDYLFTTEVFGYAQKFCDEYRKKNKLLPDQQMWIFIDFGDCP